jgi:hypothetical protein
MKRRKIYERIDVYNIENPAIDLFLEEIKEVCKKHNFSLSTLQDCFIINEYNESNIEWLFDALDGTSSTACTSRNIVAPVKT